MPFPTPIHIAVLAGFALLVGASPAPTAKLADLEPRDPLITPSPVRRDITKTHQRRGIVSDITQDVGSDVNSVLSFLGSDIPSYVASGVPNFFQGECRHVAQTQ